MPLPAVHRRLAAALTAGLVAAFLVAVAGSAHAAGSSQRTGVATAGTSSGTPHVLSQVPASTDENAVGLDVAVVGPPSGSRGRVIATPPAPESPTRPQESDLLTTDGRGPPAP